MEGTSLPSDWAGAFVNVYVGANNIIEAIKTAEMQLLADLYKPDNTYSAYEIDMDRLEENNFNDNDDDGVSVENIRGLNEGGGLLYGAFHGFPPEQDEIH
jgi:hypothetical protein